ncbi:MAG: signal peptidase I [Candidatus Paceibacterota bacterium]
MEENKPDLQKSEQNQWSFASKESEGKVSKAKGFFSSLWELIQVIVLAALIVWPIRTFIFQPFIVQGSSMQNNYWNGDYLIIDELSYRFSEPQRGDVIVFEFPGECAKSESEGVDKMVCGKKCQFKLGQWKVFEYQCGGKQMFIKRIIGLPGEKVEMKNNQIHITDKTNKTIVLDESKYLSPGVLTIMDKGVTLGQSEYYVLGDNRIVSYDSRMWGVLPRDFIIGKVFVRPLSPKLIFNSK